MKPCCLQLTCTAGFAVSFGYAGASLLQKVEMFSRFFFRLREQSCGWHVYPVDDCRLLISFPLSHSSVSPVVSTHQARGRVSSHLSALLRWRAPFWQIPGETDRGPHTRMARNTHPQLQHTSANSFPCPATNNKALHLSEIQSWWQPEIVDDNCPLTHTKPPSKRFRPKWRFRRLKKAQLSAMSK